MKKQKVVVCLASVVSLLFHCTAPSVQPPTSSQRGPVAGGPPLAATGAVQLMDWGLTSAPKVAPMRMDRVMAAVDQKVGTRRYSRIGSYSAYRRPHKGPDKTKAPYFHIPGQSDSQETLPLQSTSAQVDIAGVIARVVVKQVYRNRGKQPIEAVYVFPGSTRAAVHGMRMRIGKRTIVARIKERKQARAAYEAAKRAGKRASLLTQERPNVFTMNVANIMPGDVIQVELLYSELLVPEEGVYSFVYPTVVGPRNPMNADPGTTNWTANPYLKAGQKAPYAFDVKVRLQSPIGLKEVTSPSHAVRVTYASAKSASVALKSPGGGNRDFVLRYRLAGNKIETGAMLFQDGKEKFFLVMMEPPKRVTRKQIPAREYIFVLDVSGSMYGFPLNTAKQLMQKLLTSLRPTDLFNVVLFAGRAGSLNPTSVPATPQNIQQALSTLRSLRGGGGTDLLSALRTSYGLPRPDRRAISRNIVVVTDGYVAVEAQAFRYIRKRLNQANLFSFGIGRSVNRALIEGMARAGMGAPFVVLKPEEAAAKAAKFRAYIDSPVLTNIEVSYQGLSFHDVVPKKLPDLMAQRPLILFGKYTGTGNGTIEIAGATGQGAFKRRITIDPSAARPRHKPLRVLWARKWAEMLMDQYRVLGGDPEIEKAVTNLGLRYSLLTRFTSFVAIDSEVVNKSGTLDSVKQPLPLPAGVSNRAVAGSTAAGFGGGGAGYYRRARRMHRSSALRSLSGSPAPTVAAESPAPRARPRGGSLGDLLQSAGGMGSTRRHVAIRVGRVDNVSSQYVALARALVRRACHSCARSTGWRGTFTIRISASGRVTLVGGSAALRRCLQIGLARRLRMLTRRAGWLAHTGRSARIVVTFR